MVAALPLAVAVLFLAAPATDVRWEHHPAHFWLVLGAALLNAGLALATGESARRRADARLVLLSAAFLVAAGFLGLHALATPGVLLDGPNAGFVLATPAGLLAAAVLAAASALELRAATAAAVVRRAAALRTAVLVVLGAWAAVSLASLAPLDDPTPTESRSLPLAVLAGAGVPLYLAAAAGYARRYAGRPTVLGAGVIVALVLLAEATAVVAAGRNWHALWWEWHVLLLAAFALIAAAARREAPEERFSDLYLARTAAGRREISVVFADLAGFTAFAERHEPEAVAAMLNAYFAVALPAVVAEHGGDVDRLMGDAVMATFNTRGDQPDHAARAARAALALQRETGRLAAEHPGWPRFRAGVNSGEALVGVLGAAEGRSYTVVGDAVNVAARLESAAPVGGVAVGAATLRALPGARAGALGALEVKGRAEPVDAFLLEAVPPASRDPAR